MSDNQSNELVMFAEECQRFFFRNSETLLLPPEKGAEFERLHKRLFELVRDGLVRNVIGQGRET